MSREFRVVATGLRFPEGPTALGDGSLAVVEMQGEAVARVGADGTVTQLGDLGGGPNGSTLGSDGSVYVANNGGLSAGASGYWHAPRQFDGCVQRVTAEGSVSVVGGTLPGDAPHRPNDICFAPDGALLVTDSADWEDMRNLPPGRIVSIDEHGHSRTLAELPALPNGIAFGPGDDRLYVAQSLTRKLLVYHYRDGELSEPVEVCKLPTGMPDGMCVAADGTLFVCGSVGNAIFVYDPSGELRETIEVPDGSQPTNCCLSEGSLYVTLAIAGTLVAFDVGMAELPLHTGSIAVTDGRS